MLSAGVGSVLLLPANHDIAWTLEVGRRILEGGTLYVDVVDVHPPLIFWYGAFAAAASAVAGVSGILAYKLVSLVIVGVSLWMSWLNARAPVLTTALAFVFLPWVGFDFGQGEHLFMLLTAPYLLMTVGRLEGEAYPRRLSWPAGILAGIGFSMKPFFLLAFLAVELYALSRTGPRTRLREETAGVAVVVATYLFAAAAFTREYIDVLPMALSAYPDYRPSTPAALLMSWPMALFAEIVIVLRLARRGTTPTHHVFMVAAGTLVLTVFLQNKGFGYHWYPATACSLLILISAFAAHPRLPLMLTVTAFMGITVSQFRWSGLSAAPYHLDEMRSVVKRTGGPVLTLSTITQLTYPLVTYAGTTSVSRFAALWPAPAAFQQRKTVHAADTADVQALRAYLRSAVTEDLVRGCPSVIIVDLAPLPNGQPGDVLLEEFLTDARFRREFANFAPVGTVGERYRIYERSGRSGPPRGERASCPEATGIDTP